jgi:non-heme chloroperoxidase
VGSGGEAARAGAMADGCSAFGFTTADQVRIVGRRSRPLGGGADIVFIHGFSMSGLCWGHQMASPALAGCRLVSYDLRGHGGSDKPTAPEFYREGWRWAHELRGVIELLGLERPVLVAWSYGVRIVVDYLSAFGERDIGGINIVGSRINSNPAFAGPAMGALQQAMGSPDLADNIRATIGFVDGCALVWPERDFRDTLAAAMVVPDAVRRAMMGRTLDADGLFGALTVPVLFSHGRFDPVAPVAAAEHGAATAPNGRVSIYENSAHVPFIEEADRFNRELADFVATCRAHG